MEVILLERIEGLGQMGDEVSVKTGFARNYLLPQKKALRATAQNRTHFQKERAQLEAENLKRRKDAEAVGGKLDGLSIILIRQAGDAGHLYGSVTAGDIANSVTAAGFTIQKNQVALNAPIKSIGLFPVRINLHPEVSVTVTVNVARTTDEAQVQAKTGAALVSREAAADAAAKAEVEAEKFFEESALPDDESGSDDDSES